MSPVKRRLQESAERANPVAPVHFWQSPAGAGVDIFLITHLDVYSAIHEHAVSSLPNETGGFLLGRVAFDARRGSWHIEVDETVPVDPLSQDPVHFSFTWRDVDRVRSHRESQGKALLGWYHTHPDLGVFLSETDLEKTHRVLFAEPFQLALVYDPVRGRAGFFFWEGPQIIDASRAVWREFEIAVGPEARVARLHESTASAEPPSPVAPAEAPALPDGDRGSDRPV
jgi:proteasome lid subunit RPN8/RPN11